MRHKYINPNKLLGLEIVVNEAVLVSELSEIIVSYKSKKNYCLKSFFLNEWQELCLSIKEEVKEFYVQVIEQPQGKTE
jgi:hypothetical protein